MALWRRTSILLWVLLALLLAPTLGVWHGYVHSHGHHAYPAALVHEVSEHADDDDEAALSTGWMARLYASHHQASDCQQFDQAAHADALTAFVASVVLFAPVALPQPAIAESRAPASGCAHYAARAPPASA